MSFLGKIREYLPGVHGSTKPELKMPPTQAGQEELSKKLRVETHETGWDAKIIQAKKRIAGEEGMDVDVSDLK
mgnify:CR=1 FL=1